MTQYRDGRSKVVYTDAHTDVVQNGQHIGQYAVSAALYEILTLMQFICTAVQLLLHFSHFADFSLLLATTFLLFDVGD